MNSEERTTFKVNHLKVIDGNSPPGEEPIIHRETHLVVFHPSITSPGIKSTAHCHPNDNYCRATGRIVALTRALQHLPRSVRKEIWADYWDKFPKVP